MFSIHSFMKLPLTNAEQSKCLGVCERTTASFPATVSGLDLTQLLQMSKIADPVNIGRTLTYESGRWDSNPRRPAWEHAKGRFKPIARQAVTIGIARGCVTDFELAPEWFPACFQGDSDATLTQLFMQPPAIGKVIIVQRPSVPVDKHGAAAHGAWS